MQDEPEAGVGLAFAGAEVHNIENHRETACSVRRLNAERGHPRKLITIQTRDSSFWSSKS
jgi:hypothetical protein